MPKKSDASATAEDAAGKHATHPIPGDTVAVSGNDAGAATASDGPSETRPDASQLREELGVRRQASALLARATEVHEEALAQADQLIAEAQSIAERAHAEAAAEAERLRAQAAQDAERLHDEAGQEADRLRAEAAEQAAAVRGEAGAEAERLRAEAVEQAERLQAEAAEQAASVRGEASGEAEAVLGQAMTEAAGIREQVRLEAETTRAELDQERAAAREAARRERLEELTALNARVERLVSDVQSQISGLGNMLQGAHLSVREVLRTAEQLAEAMPTELVGRAAGSGAVGGRAAADVVADGPAGTPDDSSAARDEGAGEMPADGPRGDAGEDREGGGSQPPGHPGDEAQSDAEDLDNALSGARPLGWLFRGN